LRSYRLSWARRLLTNGASACVTVCPAYHPARTCARSWGLREALCDDGCARGQPANDEFAIGRSNRSGCATSVQNWALQTLPILRSTRRPACAGARSSTPWCESLSRPPRCAGQRAEVVAAVAALGPHALTSSPGKRFHSLRRDCRPGAIQRVLGPLCVEAGLNRAWPSVRKRGP
jgi:hypothetical protein